MRKVPLTMASMLLFGFLLACNQSEQRSKLGYVPHEFDFGFQGIAGRLLRGGEPDGAAAIVDLALALDPEDEELRLMKDRLADSIARS